jgi:hypothetical protein
MGLRARVISLVAGLAICAGGRTAEAGAACGEPAVRRVAEGRAVAGLHRRVEVGDGSRVIGPVRLGDREQHAYGGGPAAVTRVLTVGVDGGTAVRALLCQFADGDDGRPQLVAEQAVELGGARGRPMRATVAAGRRFVLLLSSAARAPARYQLALAAPRL